MKKNATTKTKKNTKNTGKLPCKKALNPKLKKTIKATKLKISITPATKRTGTKTQNASKTSKNTPKKARERVTVSNYQKLAMRTCLPQCKCWEYAIPELASEWHEALAKIEGTRAKLVRLDGNASVKEWHSKKIQEIKEELGDIFWSLALVCELNGKSFEKSFKHAFPTRADGCQIPFWFFPERDGNELPAPVEAQISGLKRICRCMGIKASDCLEANIRKLSKRQAENKIQGDGDKR